jgi:hypothetical protein
MIAAVIATRYRPPELAELLRVLEGDGVLPIVLDSEAYGHRLYRMWNAGVRQAHFAEADFIAVLNDDVALKSRTLPFLAGALMEDETLGVVYPDVNACWCDGYAVGPVVRTTGSWGAGGMTGFCFMFRTDLGVPFDEKWGLWYGDDAFEEAVRGAGMAVGRLTGVPVRHAPMGSTSRDMGHWGPIIEADRARWDRLHA